MAAGNVDILREINRIAQAVYDATEGGRIKTDAEIVASSGSTFHMYQYVINPDSAWTTAKGDSSGDTYVVSRNPLVVNISQTADGTTNGVAIRVLSDDLTAHGTARSNSAYETIVIPKLLGNGGVYRTQNCDTSGNTWVVDRDPIQTQKSVHTAHTAVTLTTAWATGTEFTAADDYSQCSLYVDYTAGTTEDGMHLKIQTSHDFTNWFDKTSESISSGSVTLNPLTLAITATTTGPGLMYEFPICTEYVRFAVKAIGDASSAGDTSVVATFGHA